MNPGLLCGPPAYLASGWWVSWGGGGWQGTGNRLGLCPSWLQITHQGPTALGVGESVSHCHLCDLMAAALSLGCSLLTWPLPFGWLKESEGRRVSALPLSNNSWAKSGNMILGSCQLEICLPATGPWTLEGESYALGTCLFLSEQGIILLGGGLRKYRYLTMT